MAEKKIMFVDDDVMQRLSIKKTLNMLGYTVAVYDNPEDAVSALRDEAFPVIITDLDMPDMDGIEFCRKVREIISKCVIYALSGYLKEYDYENLENYGFDGHLSKPIEPQELKIAIDGAFEKLGLS